MHTEAMAFVTQAVASLRPETVVELGSRDINGSPRHLFPDARYVGVDIEPGPGVDVVADACEWVPDVEYDVVLCLEVLEHTAAWQDIIHAAGRVLRAGGLFVITAATDPREPHSAVDGGTLRDGEFYENIDPSLLGVTLHRAGFDHIEVSVLGGDVRATASKP